MESDLYKFVSTLAKFRTKMGSSLYESKQIERYVDDQFFAFTRGNVSTSCTLRNSYNACECKTAWGSNTYLILQVFVATTNIGGGQSLSRTITYHPYHDGTSEWLYIGHIDCTFYHKCSMHGFDNFTALVNVLNANDRVTVNGGSFSVNIRNGIPVVYTPQHWQEDILMRP